MFIKAALGFMQLDDPQWWSKFCEVLQAIDYQSPLWTMALVSALSCPSQKLPKPLPPKPDATLETAIRRGALLSLTQSGA
ncbi:hypothetical protein PR003_g17579 [Phytophthora rubi]|uniref:Uncharacterized protein n=1 Tax=Phytophthora rubi TaxID=129364 RepID=A0A6A3KKU0_9STRA|nr:hypothetical protein PR001_g16916 [Phytophthora rubi]KAE9034686.1 hypothetical protein PR002_g7981 [Phytophthora rubi]KAE9320945.1 hypothetical protein PR003_g17579 [Phytophthora rubi]